MDELFGVESHYVWFVLAAILALTELAVPGVFLIWIAIAAAVTGAAAAFLPLNLAGELTLFGIASASTVFLGRRWYLTHEVTSQDPLLNNKAARLIGMKVDVIQPITATSGRVKVGDSEWPARGPALQPGDVARIVDVAAGVLVLEDLEGPARVPTVDPDGLSPLS